MKVSVTGQSCAVELLAPLVSGTVGLRTACFTFSQEWDGLDKLAVFRTSFGISGAQDIEDNSCEIPWNVLSRPGTLTVGVIGVKNGVRLPTVWGNPVRIDMGASSDGKKQAPYSQPFLEATLEKARESARSAASSVARVQQIADAVDGAVFTPSVSPDGILSWSNGIGRENPEPVNIKGAKGDPGERGEQGPTGERGEKGEQGIQGETGDNGADGSPAGFGTPTASVVTLSPGSNATVQVHASGEDTAKVFSFSFGIPRGADGAGGGGGSATPGTDGGYYIPSVDSNGNLSWSASKSDMPVVAGANIKGATGPQGPKGDTGATGAAGPQGNPGQKGDTGATGPRGPAGQNGTNGTNGADGEDGITPTIGQNGNWFIGNTDTGKPSRGAAGAAGATGQNGTNGQDGQSAYAAAQQGGYGGTQAAFYADLAAMDGLAAWFAAL